MNTMTANPKYETARYMVIEGIYSSEASDEGIAQQAREWGHKTFQGHPKEDDILWYIDWLEARDMSDCPF